MMFRIVLFVVLLSVASAKILSYYTDCGGYYGFIHSIELTPCAQNMTVCEVTKGHSYTAHINFTAHEDTLTATNLVYGLMDDKHDTQLWTPQHVQGYGNGHMCPVTAGLAQTYVATAVCPDADPRRLTVNWTVHNDKGHRFICAEFPLQIV